MALKDFNKAIELDNNFYQAYYNRGSVLERLGKKKMAESDFKNAKKIAEDEIEKSKK